MQYDENLARPCHVYLPCHVYSELLWSLSPTAPTILWKECLPLAAEFLIRLFWFKDVALNNVLA